MKQLINNMSKELLPYVKLNIIINTLDKIISRFVSLLLFGVGVWLLFKLLNQIVLVFGLR